MTSSITRSHECIILDACCVLNLYASKQMMEILNSIAEDVTITAYVHDIESLSVYELSKLEAPDQKEVVNLQPVIDLGLIKLVNFENIDEQSLFIDLLGKRLDDGEATSIAIAASRDWAISTDDKAARKICQLEFDTIQLISTAELIKHWVDHTLPSLNLVSDTLRFIEKRANYAISPRDPLFDWWKSFDSR